MKFRISLVLLTLAWVGSSAVTAHARDCTNLTIKGSYVFTIHGQILTPNGPLLVDGIARTTFDSNGNLTQVDAVAVNGSVPPGWRPGTGTFSVNPDCTGTMTIVNENMPPLNLQIVVAQSGNTIHTVVINPGFAVTGEAERVQAPKREDRD